MRPLICMLTIAAGVVAVPSAVGQTFEVRRASVLATDMRVDALTPPRVLTAEDCRPWPAVPVPHSVRRDAAVIRS